IIAAHVWGRAVIRASELKANHMGTAEPRRQSRKAPAQPRAPALDLRSVPLTPGAAPRSALAELRGRIRLVLGRVPCADQPLTAAQVQLCRTVASADLPEAHGKALRESIAGVGSLSEGNSCRTAWEALVALNATAREL